jgi:hypothetical protein
MEKNIRIISIFLSPALLESDATIILSYLTHEIGHFVSYDNGASNPERAAEHIGNKVGDVRIGGTLTAKEKEDYLTGIQERYAGMPDKATATEFYSRIPNSEKEDYTIGISGDGAVSYKGIRINVGTTKFYIRNNDDVGKNNLLTEVVTLDGSFGIATPDAGISTALTYLPNANSPEDVTGWIYSIGGTLGLTERGICSGIDLIVDLQGEVIGIRYNLGFSLASVEVHGMQDYSMLYHKNTYINLIIIGFLGLAEKTLFQRETLR